MCLCPFSQKLTVEKDVSNVTQRKKLIIDGEENTNTEHFKCERCGDNISVEENVCCNEKEKLCWWCNNHSI